MPRGIPTPMEDVPPKETRDHAWHWGTILDSTPRPGRRTRVPMWWGGLVVAAIAGSLLGSSIVYTVMRDSWPFAGVIGVMLLVVHAVSLGIGQLGHLSRLTRSEFGRIVAVYGMTGLIAGAVAYVVLV